jgi:hypothetical protein
VSTGHAGRRRAEWQAGERKLVAVELTADDWDAQKIPPTFRRGRAAKFRSDATIIDSSRTARNPPDW